MGYQGDDAHRTLRSALLRVANEASRRRCGLIYFERLRDSVVPRAGDIRRMRIVRIYDVWMVE